MSFISTLLRYCILVSFITFANSDDISFTQNTTSVLLH